MTEKPAEATLNDAGRESVTAISRKERPTAQLNPTSRSSGSGSGRMFTVLVALFSALGGVLFGLDIGYISGVQAMESFHLSVNGGVALDSVTEGIVVSIFSAGAIATAFPPSAGAIADAIGSKLAISAGGTVFCVGAVIQGFSFGIPQLIVGRFISGAAIGVLSTNVPIYQAELAEPAMRGALVSLYQLAITFGIMAAFWLNFAVKDAPHGWRISILLQVVPGLVLMLGMLFLPNSPRWLVRRGRRDEAETILLRLRSSETIVAVEMQQIMREAEVEAAAGQVLWKDFCTGTMRYP